jgi:hypothetical protein
VKRVGLVWSWAVVLVAGCGAHVAPPPAPNPATPPLDQPWVTYWSSRAVSPAPPRQFMEWTEPLPEIVNLTGGALDDETVRKWALADLRRGNGDSWASCHLRLDMTYANVFGPPGLNGTDRGIVQARVDGVVALDCAPGSVTEAVAVIAIPKALQHENPEAGFTDFVIVTRYRATGVAHQRTFADGHRQQIPSPRAAGDLTWQLDTGAFRDDPIVGPLWYQARGWACGVDGRTRLDRVCALLAPAGTRPPPVPLRASR